jgi:hypothetical protein
MINLLPIVIATAFESPGRRCRSFTLDLYLLLLLDGKLRLQTSVRKSPVYSRTHLLFANQLSQLFRCKIFFCSIFKRLRRWRAWNDHPGLEILPCSVQKRLDEVGCIVNWNTSLRLGCCFISCSFKSVKLSAYIQIENEVNLLGCHIQGPSLQSLLWNNTCVVDSVSLQWCQPLCHFSADHYSQCPELAVICLHGLHIICNGGFPFIMSDK